MIDKDYAVWAAIWGVLLVYDVVQGHYFGALICVICGSYATSRIKVK